MAQACWADITVLVNARPLISLDKVGITYSQDTEPIYGKGVNVLDFSCGNKRQECTLTIKHSDYFAMKVGLEAVPGARDLRDLRNIVMIYNSITPANAEQIVTEKFTGGLIQSVSHNAAQNEASLMWDLQLLFKAYS